MQLTQLQLKHFRCFKDVTITFENPIVLIEGANGAGKTSLLEALYYACYARSFRTHNPTELVEFNHQSFFVKIKFINDNQAHELQVGFADKKRLIKLDHNAVATYKELLDHYRVITITEDDLELIKGAPEERRRFLDQAVLLQNPDYLVELKKLRHIVIARTRLLKTYPINKDSYDVWTEQLESCSETIRNHRKQLLQELQTAVNRLLISYIDGHHSVVLEYIPTSYKPELYEREVRFGRSFFGAHLDEVVIHFQEKKSRTFASRGQQKLLLILLKIAQAELLLINKGSTLFLLDDFMTDFDNQRAQALVKALTSLKCQLLFTSPVQAGSFENYLYQIGVQQIKLTY